MHATMLTRMKHGYRIGKRSFRVLRGDPRLLAFPLVSTVIVLVTLLLLGGAALGASSVTNVGGASELWIYGALFVIYFVSTAIATFFTAALTHCVASQFDGEPATFRDGLGAAWRARRKVLIWAAAAATVGVVVRLLEERFGFVGAIVAWVFNASWAILTFFVVPVMVLDDVSTQGMFRKSATTFRETWGESATVSLGLSAVVALVTAVPVVILVVLFVAGIAPLVMGALVVVVVAIAALVAQTLGAISRTALYLYARDGESLGPFNDVSAEDILA